MVGSEAWERWAQSLGELRDWPVGFKGNRLGWAGLQSMGRAGTQAAAGHHSFCAEATEEGELP